MPMTKAKLIATLNRMTSDMEEARQVIETEKDERREEWDGKSERYQESDRGVAAEGIIDQLESLYDSIDNIVTELEDLKSELEAE